MGGAIVTLKESSRKGTQAPGETKIWLKVPLSLASGYRWDTADTCQWTLYKQPPTCSDCLGPRELTPLFWPLWNSPQSGMCSLPESQEPMQCVAVTGGTHGNEMSGVYLARHWLQVPGELRRPSFSAIPILANPAATAACRRYVDRDLNRTFTHTFLNSRITRDDPYELTRARELNQLLGPKGTGQAFDFILDLHNTTANTGICLISEASHSHFNLHLCRYLQLQNPELPCRILQYQPSGEETYSVESVSKDGIGTTFPAFEMDIYRNLGSVDFPRAADGDLAGTVHPRLQVAVGGVPEHQSQDCQGSQARIEGLSIPWGP
ncbi:LOW QUALITY PROTEIN: N-acyl-aromatic-L-amino acid amidohydrolase (carboxylate-forming)-like [Nannospalax galili]|uniref:LOW QUALITY PROTEIN: N-acyl-aromatic-L-amino acid amidohydrolase (carboxylate-forming)-like n=1 Tax=Nannospalax galili TaxID=1026970 RepID=UPI00111C6618|nr:LOW QUALITY PROTEIN: N-acyl-aromatic-L-amino acid amidohydrolase (carboxylate-forming)-like [Nannospalax galili]